MAVTTIDDVNKIQIKNAKNGDFQLNLATGGMQVQKVPMPLPEDFTPNQNTIYSIDGRLFVYDGEDFVMLSDGGDIPQECDPPLRLCGVRVYNTSSYQMSAYTKNINYEDDYMCIEWGQQVTIGSGRTGYIQVLGDPEDHINDLLVINVRGNETSHTFAITQGAYLTQLFANNTGSNTDFYFNLNAYASDVDLSNITITVTRV